MFRVFTVFNNGFSDLCLNQHAKYCKKKIRACLSLFSDQLLSSQNIFCFIPFYKINKYTFGIKSIEKIRSTLTSAPGSMICDSQ